MNQETSAPATGPQAATQDVDPRAAVLDAIADVIRTGRYWLPAAGQQAIGDAVLALQPAPAETCRACHSADDADRTRETLTDQELHRRRAHPDWEYATTEGPRKQWTDADTPPYGDDGEPDHTWERNLDAGCPGEGWERFDYTEESYWRRRKTHTKEAIEEEAPPRPDGLCRCRHTRDLHNSTDCAGCTHEGLTILRCHSFIDRTEQP